MNIVRGSKSLSHPSGRFVKARHSHKKGVGNLATSPGVKGRIDQ